MSNLGVASDNHIIIYDNHPKHAMFSAPRLWWMFNVFGHSNVSILNGGLTSWLKLGYVTTHGPYSEDESRTSEFMLFLDLSHPSGSFVRVDIETLPEHLCARKYFFLDISEITTEN